MKDQKGQIFIIGLIVLAIITLTTLLMVSGSLLLSNSSRYSIESAQALNLAEAGIDKAVASINKSSGSYIGEPETTLGAGSFDIRVTTLQSGRKLVESTGYIPNKTRSKSKRTVKTEIAQGIGTSFRYAVQAGQGGFVLENNAVINGSVYSNGDVNLKSNARIAGDTWVAGGTQPLPDQQSDCSLPNCADFIFGKQVSGQDILDVAQSFKPQVSQTLNKVAVKVKKIGSPSDIKLRIHRDNNGKPDKGNILASATLPSSLVGSDYSFIEVAFPSPPSLSALTTYWITLDTSSNQSNYWSWSQDNALPGYSNGSPLWTDDLSKQNPVWTSIPGDLGFKTYMGGVNTKLYSSNGTGSVGADAHANTIQNMSITGGAYYQTITASTAGSLHPGSTDPATQIMPISQANIDEWKTSAQASSIHTGDITTCPGTLTSKKIIGSVTLPGECTLTITAPIWITGDLTLNNNSTIQLNSSLGSASGVIVVSGKVQVGNTNRFLGSGSSGSYLMILAEYDSTQSGASAITLGNGNSGGIFYTSSGIIQLNNNSTVSSITAWKIQLSQNVIINYDQGLSSTFFSSGPGGSFSVVPGTYQIIQGPTLPAVTPTPTPPPPFSVTCSGSPNPATSGDTVTWSAIPSGGTPAYVDYLWSGDDALTGTSSTATKAYSVTNTATKNASISVKDSSNPQKIATASCAVTITLPYKRVFVTNTQYDGNLGGLAGADTKCQTIANNKGWGQTTWKAWLSSSTVSATSRLTHSSLPYKRIDGSVIASDWTDLVDGVITVPISIDENGTIVGTGDRVWTTTHTDGTISKDGASCSDWTTTVVSAWPGVATATGINWTSEGTKKACTNIHRLYCFEQ